MNPTKETSNYYIKDCILLIFNNCDLVLRVLYETKVIENLNINNICYETVDFILYYTLYQYIIFFEVIL